MSAKLIVIGVRSVSGSDIYYIFSFLQFVLRYHAMPDAAAESILTISTSKRCFVQTVSSLPGSRLYQVIFKGPKYPGTYISPPDANFPVESIASYIFSAIAARQNVLTIRNTKFELRNRTTT